MMGSSVKFKLPDSVLSEAFRAHQDQKLFTDLLIRTSDGQQVHGHRLVLAAASQTIRRSLLDASPDEEAVIILPDFHKDEILSIFPYLYGGCDQDSPIQSSDLVRCLQIGVWNELLLEDRCLATGESNENNHSNPSVIASPSGKCDTDLPRMRMRQRTKAVHPGNFFLLHR